MARFPVLSAVKIPLTGSPWVIAALIGCNFMFNIIANSCFKVSTASTNWRHFLAWQVAGNIAGLMTVLTLTGVMRYLPLHMAYPVCMGLAVIGVQIVGAYLIFHETISVIQWLGTLLVIFGIVLICQK